jgi:hypothetical protein
MKFVCKERPYPFIELTTQPYQGKHVSFMPDGELDTLVIARRIGACDAAIEEAVRAHPAFGVTIFEVAEAPAETGAEGPPEQPSAEDPPATTVTETPTGEVSDQPPAEHAPPTADQLEAGDQAEGPPDAEGPAIGEPTEADDAAEGGELEEDA